jgi:hypothetical protein
MKKNIVNAILECEAKCIAGKLTPPWKVTDEVLDRAPKIGTLVNYRGAYARVAGAPNLSNEGNGTVAIRIDVEILCDVMEITTGAQFALLARRRTNRMSSPRLIDISLAE